MAIDITKDFAINAVLKEKYPLGLTPDRKKYILENVIQYVQNPAKKSSIVKIFNKQKIFWMCFEITPDFATDIEMICNFRVLGSKSFFSIFSKS